MEATAAAPRRKRGPEKAKSAADWKRRRVHTDVTLPSGTVVDITLPNLPQLIKSGKLPNALLEAALRQQNAQEVTKELLEETWDYTEYIIPLMLVEPEISAEDVAELPAEDLELLTAFASRQTDVDAAYRQLGGLDTLDRFREARGIWTSAEDDATGEGGNA